ncbi:unnamed protein product [Nezara viridula]|uniref:UDP-glucuronosyltransferase n=1 Tax=Nezara viridula TaxID=85310 RepID=A0A9P0HGW1_NEZVI|nr:unnamed protein product [Nezara viridula]
MNVFIFFALFTVCSASNILLMFPMSAKSHVNSFVPLFKKLSEKGHNITMVTSFEPKVQIPNCTYIIVKNIMEDYLTDSHVQEDVQIFRELKPFSIWPLIWNIHLEIIEKLLEGDCLRELMSGDYSFDVMISETLYLFEIFVAFGHIFQVPVISIDAHPMSAWSAYLTGNVHPYSYVPNYRLPITDEMSLMERVENTLLNLEEMLGSYFYYMPRQEELMRKYLNYEKYNFPPLLDMLQNISLTLVDSHFSLGYVRPYLPHTVEVAGLTFSEGGELNEEFQEYLDGSENGFIYFTFGSIINITSLPTEMLDVFRSTFAKLKYNVVMKWEADEFPNKPKNIKTMPWLPQNRILAHPKCRLFITHGGFHGMIEAIYHKVPLVVIPFLSDQYYNAIFAKKEGFAYVLNNLNLTTENLLHAINTVMDNPEYKKHVDRRSMILKDKDQNSIDKAVYWVEYVLRHNGAKHLRPACLNLNLFQYFLLDVIFVIISAVVGCICLFVFITYVFVQILKYFYEKIYILYWKGKKNENTRSQRRVRKPKKKSPRNNTNN